MKTPAELGDISSLDLIQHPFFAKNPSDLFNKDTGSAFVNTNVKDQPVINSEWNVLGEVKVRDWLLAKAFPATTLPMGAKTCSKFGGTERNFNLSAGDIFKTDTEKWPISRKEIINKKEVKSWWHSDYKKIAYQHVYKILL